MTETTIRPSGASRLTGIELMRGIAAFAVVGLHAGLVVENRQSYLAGLGQLLFDFAVPFFLATAFYFAIRAERARALTWGAWWRERSLRLLLPFAVWSLIYFGLRLAFCLATHHMEKILPMLHHPVSLVFSGGGSLALYFIPMLFIGLTLIRLLRDLLLGAPAWALVLLLIFFSVSYEMILQSRNCYDYGTGRGFNVAFPHLNDFLPVHLILVVAAHASRALPTIFLAALAVRFLPEPGGRQTVPLIVAGGLLMALEAVITLTIGTRFPDITWGAGSFLMGWGLSGILTPSRLVLTMGAFSFGVYLVQQLVLEAMKVVFPHLVGPLPPLGFGGILLLTAIGYILSMAVVEVASRCGRFSRLVFGLK